MKKNIILISIAALLIAGGLWLWCGLSSRNSNPWNASVAGDIPAPAGYKRVEAAPGSYAAYLRSLPLKPRGSKVQLFTGGDAHLQFLSAAVIDMKLLSNYEQCADATMRLRAEYLWRQGRYGQICFTDANGRKQRYSGGASRSVFESYMRRIYGVCSTYSVYGETRPRDIADVQPGDVLVYRSRHSGMYGHAVLVVDVAKSRGGKVAVMCAEGNTPARDFHIIRNSANPLRSPWFVLDPDASVIFISAFRFNANELRHY